MSPLGSTTVSPTVNLLDTLKLLQAHLTEALCQQVFQTVRSRERERKWTLFALARFWTVVILQAPDSLTQLLQQAQAGQIPFLPAIASSTEAFFRKCKATHFRFFQNLYQAFLQRVLPDAPTAYARPLHPLLKSFSGIWAVDASGLDEILHRLKILWKEKAVVLPGCLTVYYDVLRGITRHVLFNPDAAAGELPRAETLLDSLPQNLLLLGDRLYCSVRFFSELTARGLWGLFRLNHRLKVRRDRLISRRQGGGRAVIEDWIVTVGCGRHQPPIVLRLILFRQGRIRRELLTNVVDPARLSVVQALDLYPFRWTIERFFFDLKEVCRLNNFYAANPNAVAMQVYAAAIVHTAFRIAQAKIAQAQRLAPEALSPTKLFARLAATSILYVWAELSFHETVKANPGVRLKKPDWSKSGWAHMKLSALLVEKRKNNRRDLPRRTPRKWKSLAHIRGALPN